MIGVKFEFLALNIQIFFYFFIFGFKVFGMLESLAMQDETVIREEAVASINHIA
jgi:hypothetical protein